MKTSRNLGRTFFSLLPSIGSRTFCISWSLTLWTDAIKLWSTSYLRQDRPVTSCIWGNIEFTLNRNYRDTTVRFVKPLLCYRYLAKFDLEIRPSIGNCSRLFMQEPLCWNHKNHYMREAWVKYEFVKFCKSFYKTARNLSVRHSYELCHTTTFREKHSIISSICLMWYSLLSSRQSCYRDEILEPLWSKIKERL